MFLRKNRKKVRGEALEYQILCATVRLPSQSWMMQNVVEKNR